MPNFLMNVTKNRDLINSQINRQRYDAYMYYTTYINTYGSYKSKDYINTLLSTDKKIINITDNKVNKDELSQDVNSVVQNYINTNGITNVSSINKAIQDAIDALNAQKQQLLSDINVHSYQAMSSINTTTSNTLQYINSSVNTSVQSALLAINTNTSNLNNTINTINASLANSLQQAITIIDINNASLNASLQQALTTIDSQKQQAILDIAEASSTAYNNSLQDALVTIDNQKQQALAEINVSSYNAIAEIKTLASMDDDTLVLSIRGELLQKIDYIFQMFYHANSKIIMENYPI